MHAAQHHLAPFLQVDTEGWGGDAVREAIRTLGQVPGTATQTVTSLQQVGLQVTQALTGGALV